MIKNLMSKLNNKPEGVSGEMESNPSEPTITESIPVAPAPEQLPSDPNMSNSQEVSRPPNAPVTFNTNSSSEIPTAPAVHDAISAPQMSAPVLEGGGTNVPQPPTMPQAITNNYPPAMKNVSGMGGGSHMSMQNQFTVPRGPSGEGIIIDLGEGISLNVPIRKRMTITEFLKVAEKVKALETLSEERY